VFADYRYNDFLDSQIETICRVRKLDFGTRVDIVYRLLSQNKKLGVEEAIGTAVQELRSV
jgi:hypothetical protein